MGENLRLVKYAIIDYRILDEIKNELSKYAENIIPTIRQNTYESICGHSDIQLCKIDDNTIVCAPNCFEYYKSRLSGVNVICGEKNPNGNYPNDVLYNVCTSDGFAMHNFKYTDKITLAVIEQKFSKHINVRQGYSCCSTCAVGNAVITEDSGIYRALTSNGIDALKISSGSVVLKGMNYGFFGGAVGVYKNNFFTVGNLDTHSDAGQINEFLKERNINVYKLADGKLRDVGSILFF